MFTDETQAICQSATSDVVVKFEKLSNFSQAVQRLAYNGDLWGVYYNESGNIVAQDIHGETQPAYHDTGKSYHIVSYQKAVLENYNYKFIASFNNEAEAQESFESYEGNAVMGYVLLEEENGTYTDYFTGEEVDLDSKPNYS